jgi:hypothetical protein
MSSQNHKRRVRERMRATGEKYTEASRNRKAREGMPSPGGAPDPLMAIARQSCSECGMPVRWVDAEDLKEVRPGPIAEFIEVFGTRALQTAGAWICPNCDAFGLTSPPEIDNIGEEFESLPLSPFLDPLDQCSVCGQEVDWIDPAQVANIDRPLFLEAKRKHGATALLDGHASRCSDCRTIQFYPHDI